MKLSISAVAFLLLCSMGSAGERGRVLIVGAAADHPWGTHMYAFECQLLAKCLQRSDVDATVIPSWPPAQDQLDHLDAVVFYSSPVGEVVLAPRHRELFRNLMESGVGLVAIHWGTGIGYSKLAERQDLRDEYRDLLGGWFRRPPCDIKVGEALIQVANADHPIARGWKEWKVRDEFYLNPVLHPMSRPLLKVRVDGADHVVAWTHRRTAGRSFGITLGHFHANFMRDDFRRLLVNGILWAANLEVPREGADVTVPPSVLQLPAKPG